MRTTININDALLNALMKRTKMKTKTKAIELAIREYLKKKAIEDLISLSGRIDIDPDWKKEEDAELDEYDEYQDHC